MYMKRYVERSKRPLTLLETPYISTCRPELVLENSTHVAVSDVGLWSVAVDQAARHRLVLYVHETGTYSHISMRVRARKGSFLGHL